jgi:DMSO/TMAO reductase YedYZ molybdopterin-dependent catalytic subunit
MPRIALKPKGPKMFRSLYTRYKNELEQTHTTPDTYLDLPATYREGLSMVDPEAWQMEIGGQVQHPQTIRMRDLQALPQITQNRRLVSAEGWTFRAEWGGIPLFQLVEQIRPDPQATLLRQTSMNGQVEFLPLAAALQNRALLCYNANGKPLSPLHGGPLRLLIFDRYSYKGMAQLARLDFVSAKEETPGFWETRGYPADGQIEPGKYYAFDLKKMRPVPQDGEVTIY